VQIVYAEICEQNVLVILCHNVLCVPFKFSILSSLNSLLDH